MTAPPVYCSVPGHPISFRKLTDGQMNVVVPSKLYNNRGKIQGRQGAPHADAGAGECGSNYRDIRKSCMMDRITQSRVGIQWSSESTHFYFKKCVKN